MRPFEWAHSSYIADLHRSMHATAIKIMLGLFLYW